MRAVTAFTKYRKWSCKNLIKHKDNVKLNYKRGLDQWLKGHLNLRLLHFLEGDATFRSKQYLIRVNDKILRR